jgi:8-oxo-dGTP pyrophosphatase MutT (NUDIX family)
VILVDSPRWPAHGTVFAHLVSDTSYAELHDFAGRAGLPRRAFDGDHYDIPERRYAAVLAAGAAPVTGAQLSRRLNASGLRLRKRKGDRGVARLLDVPVTDGLRSTVDLVAGREPVASAAVFAVMVFVRDLDGRFLTVWSDRRAEWGAPGGWREADESPVEAAVREVAEETGLGVDAASLQPCGYERFAPVPGPSRREATGDLLQCFVTVLAGPAPGLRAETPEQPPPEWLTREQWGRRAGSQFWWPLAAYLFQD